MTKTPVIVNQFSQENHVTGKCLFTVCLPFCSLMTDIKKKIKKNATAPFSFKKKSVVLLLNSKALRHRLEKKKKNTTTTTKKRTNLQIIKQHRHFSDVQHISRMSCKNGMLENMLLKSLVDLQSVIEDSLSLSTVLFLHS